MLPVHLNVDSDLSPVHGLDGTAVVGLVFLAGLIAGIVYCARRARLYPVAYGLIWFVLTQLPTSAYPLSEVENDHRMFFSFPGLILAVVWAGWLGWEWLRARGVVGRVLRVGVSAALVCALGAYAYGTHRRNEVWHDEDSLWKDDAEKSPHNGRGLMIYGLTEMNHGAYAAANATFEDALKYTPNYPTLEINLGVVNALMAQAGDASKTAEAEKHFLRAVNLAPGDDAPPAYYGRWLSQQGRFGEALYQLQRAVKLNPSRPFQRDVLIETYEHMGDAAGAKQAAQETLALMPDDAPAQAALTQVPVQAPVTQTPSSAAAVWVNASLTLGQQGKFEESIVAARKALAIDPQSAEAWNNIAAANEAMHRWDAAIDAAQRAVALRPIFQLAKNNLAWSVSQKKLGVK